MSLASQISSLASRIAAEFNAVRSEISASGGTVPIQPDDPGNPDGTFWWDSDEVSNWYERRSWSWYDDMNDSSVWNIHWGPTPTAVASADAAGGTALQAVGGGNQWYWHNAVLIPYDPTALYKMTVRVRCATDPTTGGNAIYAGLEGVAADGVTMVNVSGVSDHSSQHYVVASNVALTAAQGWQTFSGYVRGLAGTGSNGVTSAYSPGAMHSGTRFIRPMILSNYADGDGTYEWDLVTIERIDPDLAPQARLAGHVSYVNTIPAPNTADGATQTGFYDWQGASASIPDLIGGATLEVIAYNDSWITQRAHSYDVNRVFRRNKVNGTWGGWLEEGSVTGHRAPWLATAEGSLTVAATGEVSWSGNSGITILGGGTGPQFGSAGYFDIAMPPVGTVIGGYGGAEDVTVTATGIPLRKAVADPWAVLYYKLPIGAGYESQPGNFILVGYAAGVTRHVPDTWVPIAVKNGYGNAVRWITGHTVRPGTTWDYRGGVTANRGGQEAVNTPATTTGTVTLNLDGGSVFTITPTGNITLAMGAVPASGVACTITVVVNQGGTAYTVTMPAGAIWLGSAPTQAANKKCVITMMTTDGGTSWICSGAVQA